MDGTILENDPLDPPALLTCTARVNGKEEKASPECIRVDHATDEADFRIGRLFDRDRLHAPPHPLGAPSR